MGQVYRGLGRSDDDRQAGYRQLFRAQVSKADMDVIRQSTNKGWALGGARFRAKIETLSDRRTSPLPKGRPRKQGEDENNGV
jgi:putative transposase